MLEINNLSFCYPGRNHATIDHFSLEIAPGGVYGLLGRNGVGKSTLLYLIAGLLTPDHGHVLLDGTDTRERLPRTLQSIMIVPEELTLPPITLKRFVAINAPLYPRFSHDDLHRHLTTFEIDPEMPYKLTSLSMGQRKKVYTSFALACNTPVVLMDEPTNGLDIPGKMAFRRFVAANMTDERSIIISTHQVRDIETLLDHVLIISPERVLLNASTAAIASRLAFVHTTDPDVASRALYAQPAIGGISAVLPNDGSYDTEINLESLFELATQQPDTINRIFSQQ
ncbi:MAG: ABC transporter ATP-binding protein [Muribaculaceae bacterium]|nr:ABC transporter ATP-binding protein [Muribaculaceae bacterium]